MDSVANHSRDSDENTLLSVDSAIRTISELSSHLLGSLSLDPLSVLFLDHFEENANIFVAMKFNSTVDERRT